MVLLPGFACFFLEIQYQRSFFLESQQERAKSKTKVHQSSKKIFPWQELSIKNLLSVY